MRHRARRSIDADPVDPKDGQTEGQQSFRPSLDHPSHTERRLARWLARYCIQAKPHGVPITVHTIGNTPTLYRSQQLVTEHGAHAILDALADMFAFEGRYRCWRAEIRSPASFLVWSLRQHTSVVAARSRHQ